MCGAGCMHVSPELCCPSSLALRGIKDSLLCHSVVRAPTPYDESNINPPPCFVRIYQSRLNEHAQLSPGKRF